MRRLLTAILALAVLAGALWLLLRDRGESRTEPVRAAVPLPSPALPERVAFFFDLFVSGESLQIGTLPFPVWKRVGERALLDLGEPALDYLLSKDRTPRYGQSPGILVNVMGALTDLGAAADHPRLYPFLLHWLEPASFPRVSDRDSWSRGLRRPIFGMFARVPREEAAPACVDELTRTRRAHDLRMAAAALLLEIGRGAELRELFAGLPPNETEKQPEVRFDILGRLWRMASPGSAQSEIAAVSEWREILRSLVDEGTIVERIHSAATLMRLGDASMVELLKAEYLSRAGLDGMERNHGWTALILLSSDRADPLPLREYLRFGSEDAHRFETVSALDRLGIDYLEEPEARRVLWRHLDECPWTHWPTLLRLVRVDRARAVEYLRGLLEGGTPTQITEAVQITRRESLTELGPTITEMARRATLERDRIFYYGALGAMGVEAAYPLMLADFRPDSPNDLRAASIAGLLQYGHDEGLDRLGEALNEGDRLVLRTLFLRAQAAGAAGVPDRLWPPLLSAVRSLPGEDARLEALYTVRMGADLAQVGDGLQEAYRHEPSRRVAQEIRKVLLELAHR